MERLAQAIEESGKTRYQIHKETGIDQALLCRIVNTHSGCGLRIAEILCEYFGMELVQKGRKRKAN